MSAIKYFYFTDDNKQSKITEDLVQKYNISFQNITYPTAAVRVIEDYHKNNPTLNERIVIITDANMADKIIRAKKPELDNVINATFIILSDKENIEANQKWATDRMKEILMHGLCVYAITYDDFENKIEEINKITEKWGATIFLNGQYCVWGATLLYYAAWYDNLAAVKFLLENVANDHELNSYYVHEALQQAVWKKKYDIAEFMLKQPNVNIDHKNKDGQTMLHAILDYAEINYKSMEFLLQHGANVHCTDNDGNTPLHATVPFSNLEGGGWSRIWYKSPAAELLLKYGASIYCKNKQGETPLDLAKDYRDATSMIDATSLLKSCSLQNTSEDFINLINWIAEKNLLDNSHLSQLKKYQQTKENYYDEFIEQIKKLDKTDELLNNLQKLCPILNQEELTEELVIKKLFDCLNEANEQLNNIGEPCSNNPIIQMEIAGLTPLDYVTQKLHDVRIVGADSTEEHVLSHL
ncbi:ankyrin repeat domain-containing protein [Candidatus Tisiphia endosymbiont of Micropterix aruncella]|uniref:ankyrin repeat domain-containing protein n=1 Tax=Candidatus Tisiphia endosymbiont of Micropterix aruncella TaxID=3066271 RepID=UPI003AA8C038